MRARSQSWSDAIEAAREGDRIRAENRALRQELAALATYAETIARLETELEQSRAAMSLDAPSYERVPAKIVGESPFQNRILIDAGSRDGIQPGMAAVAMGALAGVVSEVERDRSVVTLIVSADRRIGAMTDRPLPARGIVRGASSLRLTMDVVDLDAPIELGDAVITSGYSERIPRGLLIGYVSQAVEDEAFATRRLTILPEAAPGSYTEVIVLK